MDWKKDGTLTYFCEERVPSRVVMFDLDFTITRPKSGKFVQTDTDWEWCFPNVPDRLIEIVRSGARVVIVTNQLRLGSRQYSGQVLFYIEDVIKTLAVKFVEVARAELKDIFLQFYNKFKIYIATARDRWRKPSPDIWIKHLRDIVVGDVVFVGDAAGRTKPRDFDDTDRGFAHNIGLHERFSEGGHKVTFLTPEEYFLGEKPRPYEWKSFLPHEFYATIPKLVEVLGTTPIEKIVAECNADDVGIIFLVGPPASGKSTLAKTIAQTSHRFMVINRDKLGKIDTCVLEAEKAVIDGLVPIIDNTNPSEEVRSRYMRLVTRRPLYIYMTTPHELCEHYNSMREKPVPRAAFHAFSSRLNIPQVHLPYFTRPTFANRGKKIEFMFIRPRA